MHVIEIEGTSSLLCTDSYSPLLTYCLSGLSFPFHSNSFRLDGLIGRRRFPRRSTTELEASLKHPLTRTQCHPRSFSSTYPISSSLPGPVPSLAILPIPIFCFIEARSTPVRPPRRVIKNACPGMYVWDVGGSQNQIPWVSM